MDEGTTEKINSEGEDFTYAIVKTVDTFVSLCLSVALSMNFSK